MAHEEERSVVECELCTRLRDLGGSLIDPSGGVVRVIAPQHVLRVEELGHEDRERWHRAIGQAVEQVRAQSGQSAIQVAWHGGLGETSRHLFATVSALPSVTDPSSRISRGHTDPLLDHLADAFAGATSVQIVVAFVLDRGVKLMWPFFEELLERGGQLTLVTGDYFGVTEPLGLERLLDLEGDIGLKVFETQSGKPLAFHPKAYLFRYPDGSGVGFVGSSNLSQSGLSSGVEWNYRVIRSVDGPGFAELEQAIDELRRHERVRPLDQSWVHEYRRRRPRSDREGALGIAPEGLEHPEPHEFQRDALQALRKTREQGWEAALVVLATGLGKTWLAAFDTLALAQEQGQALDDQRVLFVAHRREILDQALGTFRRIRPDCRMGMFTGAEKASEATVLFASIQTLSNSSHLEQFEPASFDYIVIDEFHHASAPTYRRVIEYFSPRFLLGLTATPERTDGGDLWSLCGNNLVFRRDLSAGIRAGLLSPFAYHGVPDDVDYSAIPWRRGSGRFDEMELERALATEARAQNALEQWNELHSGVGLGFCCSRGHADFMARYFSERGVRAVSVHAGESSAPRAGSLLDLERGRLDIVFCVDMFNEGVDIPQIGTVLMLRPTESKILWLQQLGRGLRKRDGKTLRVIDYIGNHRVFRTKLEALCTALLDVSGEAAQLREAISALREGRASLPKGCEVTYDLIPVDIFDALVPQPSGADRALLEYELLREQLGRRPSAREMFVASGHGHRQFKSSYGSWFQLVAAADDLSYSERQVLSACEDLLREVETGRMNRSFKMLVLQAMLEAGAVPGALPIEVLVERFERVVRRMAWVQGEVASAVESHGGSVRSMVLQDPVRALANTKRGGSSRFFRVEGERFEISEGVAPGVVEKPSPEALSSMVRELVELRLAEYQASVDRVALREGGAGESGEGELVVGRSYPREDVPKYFGTEFRRHWQQGIVPVAGALLLFVSLDKQGMADEHRYQDHFLSRDTMQLQSQNQTKKDGKHGRHIRAAGSEEAPVLLFVRGQRKTVDGRGAPFVYCGEVEFVSWEGEKPITVVWRLKVPLGDSVARSFGV